MFYLIVFPVTLYLNQQKDLDCCICWESNNDNENAVVAIGDITLDEKADCKDVGEFVEVSETNNSGMTMSSCFLNANEQIHRRRRENNHLQEQKGWPAKVVLGPKSLRHLQDQWLRGEKESHY